jgi:hypothetical protein
MLVLILSTGLGACAKSDSSTGPLAVSGTYRGPSADVTGNGLLTLTLSQSGSAVSGTAIAATTSGVTTLTGAVTGTLSGTTLTFTITFVTTDVPPCTLTISGTATNVTSAELSGTYSGTSTCGNGVTGGTFTLDKQ